MSQRTSLRKNIDRREFLQASAMATAGALLSPSLLGALDPSRRTRSWAALHSLRPGTIHPDGWLRTYLEKQAIQLAYSLPRVSDPFTGDYWSGAEIDVSDKTKDPWWPWEQKAYWVDGALRCALVSGNEKLLQEAQAGVEHTLATPLPTDIWDPYPSDNQYHPTFIAGHRPSSFEL
jgi:hypothetical protein